MGRLFISDVADSQQSGAQQLAEDPARLTIGCMKVCGLLGWNFYELGTHGRIGVGLLVACSVLGTYAALGNIGVGGVAPDLGDPGMKRDPAAQLAFKEGYAVPKVCVRICTAIEARRPPVG